MDVEQRSCGCRSGRRRAAATGALLRAAMPIPPWHVTGESASRDEQRDGDEVASGGGTDEGVEDLVITEHGRKRVGTAAVVDDGACDVEQPAGDREDRGGDTDVDPHRG